ncbi:MAG: putative transporter substrate binding protein [Paenibacillaceae bacterium]|nr:putative transporter substrate binding protein [Paenibacillaceae bacterium]
MRRRFGKTAVALAAVAVIAAFFLAEFWRSRDGGTGASAGSEVRTGKHTYTIALVMGMRHGDYWKTVYTGAEAAAKELGASISFLGPDDEQDGEGQTELIRQALADGADAILVAPNDEVVLTEALTEAQKQVPVLTLDTELAALKVKAHIGTDNYGSGVKAAEELVRLLGGEPGRIALVGFAPGTPKSEQREAGILSVLQSHPELQLAGRANPHSGQQEAKELVLELERTSGPLDGIIALNSAAVLGTADALDSLGKKRQVKLVSFDSTLQELELLQNGVIRSLVVQNPFGMGYLGVRHAVDALKQRQIPEQVDTGFAVVRTEDMFATGNQKLLFPLIR